MNRLQEQYNKKIASAIKEQFGYKNVMAVPKIKQINLNIGVGKHMKDNRFMESLKKDFTLLAGQAPVETKARKSIAGFKIRDGQVVGLATTLRGQRMYDFLDKLISVALPRVKDFRGVSRKGFDGRGNYNLGLKEHLVFPEISQDALEHIFGLQITIATTAGKDEPAYALLKAMKFPFKD
ncbi:MAG TPA: 50S ribosomal protein L5 [Candidatus Doudnabacteria bacterium]|nr:50S ribosomal protein L5 [Candidatus Doudnabacteria bacterium]